jgi:hypothetical protein
VRKIFPSLRGLLALFVVVLTSSARPAQAIWADGADLIYRSAHTLDEGEFEVGLFSPLQYGISDQVQISLHPILLLVLTPHASIRWRILPEGPLTVAMDLTATWSFLDEVDLGAHQVRDDDACSTCGFPGSSQLTATVSWQFDENFTLSGGVGAGMEMLDVTPNMGFIELHTSLIWRIDSENLLMAHANMNLHPWHPEPTSSETLQVMYAHAWGFLHLGVGVAVGEFWFVEAVGSVRSLPGSSGGKVFYEGVNHPLYVYPVLDMWIRL